MAENKKSPVIGENFNITINFKWLLQIIVIVCVVTYAFWTIEGRIQALERGMVLALDEIELHEQERIKSQQAHVDQMEEEVSLIKKEFNINPLSWKWGKKK